MRSIQAHARNKYISMFTNYFVAAILAAGYCAFRGAPASWLKPVCMGMMTGTFYAVVMLLFIRSAGQRGLAVTSAIGSTAALVPAGIAILLGDRVATTQYVGIVVAAAAMPMLSLATVTGKAIHQRPNFVLAIALFVCVGGSLSGNFLAFRFLEDSSIPLYLTALFGWAGVLSLFMYLADRRGGGKADIARGMAFGFSNILGTALLLNALKFVSGVIFFPVAYVSLMAMNLLVAALLWHERIKAWGYVGLALAAVATVLLNIKLSGSEVTG